MTTLVNLSQVCYRHPGTESPILKNIEFTISSKETIYLKGESGCGKSTLLKLINRLLEPDSGILSFKGTRYAETDVLALRRKIQLVTQVPFLLPASVKQNLLLSCQPAAEALIPIYLSEFNLPKGIVDQAGDKVSIGQAQRLSVIRALLMDPEILLLDEPTASLDPANREAFTRTLVNIQKDKWFAIVWVTHDEKETKEGRRLVLKGGRLDG